jgi:hypothetical protein
MINLKLLETFSFAEINALDSVLTFGKNLDEAIEMPACAGPCGDRARVPTGPAAQSPQPTRHPRGFRAASLPSGNPLRLFCFMIIMR